MSVISTQKLVLKWPLISGTGKETLHVHNSGLPGHGTLLVNRVLLRTWLLNSY